MVADEVHSKRIGELPVFEVPVAYHWPVKRLRSAIFMALS